jgi:hypothetical protein
MNDADFEVFARAVEDKLTVHQFLIEIIIANSFPTAEACKAFGKRVADHDRMAPPNLPSGSGPRDLDDIRQRRLATAAEIERIFSNAADRIEHPGRA